MSLNDNKPSRGEELTEMTFLCGLREWNFTRKKSLSASDVIFLRSSSYHPLLLLSPFHRPFSLSLPRTQNFFMMAILQFIFVNSTTTTTIACFPVHNFYEWTTLALMCFPLASPTLLSLSLSFWLSLGDEKVNRELYIETNGPRNPLYGEERDAFLCRF
jgi:hypothetical protein